MKHIFGEVLQVLNVESQDSPREDVQKFTDKYELSTPTLYDGKELASQLGVLGCPTFVLVDNAGVIVHTISGRPESLKMLIAERLR
ncbi:MAG: hypothetical protein AAGA10_13275 [Bacteroidota bacterium]